MSLQKPLAEILIADKAMAWSGLPAPPKQIQAFAPEHHADGSLSGEAKTFNVPVSPYPQADPGLQSSTVGFSVPAFVRYFDEDNAKKFLELIASRPDTDMLQAPKVTIFDQQTASVTDSSQKPFVTGVLPIEGDYGAVAYQPIIQIADEGNRTIFQATLLQDRSCRIEKLQTCLTKIEDVEMFRVMTDEEPNEQAAKTKKENSGITVQVPRVSKAEVSLPPIVVPEGMSLLVMSPGLKMNDKYMLLLVTPRRVEHEEIMVGQVPY